MQLSHSDVVTRWTDRPAHRRLVASLLVILIEALVIVALIVLGAPQVTPRKLQRELVALTLAAPKAAQEAAKPSKSPSPQPRRAPAPPKKAHDPLPIQPRSTPNMVVVSKDDFAASDIGKLKATNGTGSGKAAYGPGEGPGGKTLYPAEWYVEPPHSVLAPYLKGNVPEGSWAMIACHTIEHNHVDNCFGLGESTPGLSSALRQAAWQFLVRPPRVDGRPLVGAWVRIRFDFNEKADE